MGALRDWPTRRWVAAVVAMPVMALVLGVPTAVIDNPVFGRAIAPTGWSVPVLAATAVLGGLLFGTYVAAPAQLPCRPTRLGGAGGLLAYLAIGCPVCNKVVLLALGTTGAVRYFAPVQPVLAVVGLALTGWALRARLRAESVCRRPASVRAV